MKQISTHEAAHLIAHFFLPVLATEDTAPANVSERRNLERKRLKIILYSSQVQRIQKCSHKIFFKYYYHLRLNLLT